MFVLGCSDQQEVNSEEIYDEIVELAFEYFWDDKSEKMRSEKYGNDFDSLRGTSEVTIWDNGKYIELTVPYRDNEDYSGKGWYEYEDGEFQWLYEEDFLEKIEGKEIVYQEKKGEVKNIN